MNLEPQKTDVIPTKANIDSLIKGKFDGVYRKHIIDRFAKNKYNQIFFFAHQIQQKTKGIISAEAKYKYAFRDKRIEIALFQNRSLFLIKVMNDLKKIDKEVLEMNSIINDMKKRYIEVKIIGSIILNCEYNIKVLRTLKKLINNKFIFIDKDSLLKRNSFKNLLGLKIAL